MSYTNQTQHYGLPQYVGTDVPAWLTDVNGAFAAIDAGMNAAKVQADSAATAAGQAANDISALQSTVGTQATQISAAAQAAATAQGTANGADTKADANTQAIGGLDTRVTALEQGGGGASFTRKKTELTMSSTQQKGSLFATPDANLVPLSSLLPEGKTLDDIIGFVVETFHQGWHDICDYEGSPHLCLWAPVSRASANVTVYVTTI